MSTQADPTDNALATIASILDHPAERPPVRNAAEPQNAPETAELLSPVTAVAVAEPIDVDHYVKDGPGPLDALRFHWAARRDDEGRYFVDETIGPRSRPMTTGPMPKQDVVEFINARAAAAQRRFDEAKSAMTLDQTEREGRPHSES